MAIYIYRQLYETRTSKMTDSYKHSINIFDHMIQILEGENLGKFGDLLEIHQNILSKVFLPIRRSSIQYIASLLNSALKLNSMLSF